MRILRNQRGFSGTVFLLAILLSLPFLLWSGNRIYKGIMFNKEAGGYLKRAADANIVSLTKPELEIAIAYLEEHKMTKGYTSVLYNTPDEDIGFWYTNLKSSLEELRNLPENATSLEKSNVLMKLRETLLDKTDKGESITVPDGISVFPHNVAYAWWGWLGLLLFLASIVLFFVSLAQ